MFEGSPNQESIEDLKARVVESLRHSTEDLTLLNQFIDRREAEVENSKQGMSLNVEIAYIYKEAGLRDIAKQAFLDASEQAWQENDDELFEKLTEEANKL